jgi:hypothetical protein
MRSGNLNASKFMSIPFVALSRTVCINSRSFMHFLPILIILLFWALASNDLRQLRKWYTQGMTKSTCPMRPIGDSNCFFVVHCFLIICRISRDHTIYLCSGRVTVGVLKLNSHPRIIFVSVNPPSAINFSSATISSRGMGSMTSHGRAATLIARAIAASSLLAFIVPGRLIVRPVVLLM